MGPQEVGLDPIVVFGALVSAIAALFGILAGYLKARNSSLETQIGEAEKEAKLYLALLFMQQSDDPESRAKARRRVIQILQGQGGGLDLE